MLGEKRGTLRATVAEYHDGILLALLNFSLGLAHGFDFGARALGVETAVTSH